MKINLTIDDVDYPFETWSEPLSQVPVEIQLKGILKAIRVMTRCGEGDSILTRVATVMRRADRLATEHPEYGPI